MQFFRPARAAILDDHGVESEIGGEYKRYEIQNTDMYALEIDAFCRCIKGEIPNPVPGKEGLINQRLIDMVNQK